MGNLPFVNSLFDGADGLVCRDGKEGVFVGYTHTHTRTHARTHTHTHTHTYTNVACIQHSRTLVVLVHLPPAPPVEVSVSEVGVDHMGWREIVFICVQSATWPLAIGCLSHDMCTQLGGIPSSFPLAACLPN